MRAVVARVRSASVRVGDARIGAIDHGLLALVGVARDDRDDDAVALAKKIVTLRIFRDDAGAMNRSVAECGGSVLVVSQFTLFGDARGGRRPSFIAAAGAELGRALYERVAEEITAHGLAVATGSFGADMAVASVNDGPVTILLDTRKVF